MTTSSDLLQAIGQFRDSDGYSEAFGLLEASHNFARDCAPPAEFESAFMMQVTSHLSDLPEPAVAWFAAQGITVESP
jgi:hypothetical protein